MQLEQSPFLDLISERKVNETLKLMGRAAGDRLTPEVAREVCQRTGGKVMLTGSIAGLGSQYVLGLKAANCNTGDVLAEAQVQASGKEAVLKAMDSAAGSLRSKLGESLRSIEKYATPVEEATTPSLEALKAYSLGRKAESSKGGTPALPFYQRAVELDPNFAMAYQELAVTYGSLNENTRGAENARKAYDRREKVSERERFSIEGYFYLYATGELEKAAQVFEQWQQTYPRDGVPYRNLGIVSDSGHLGHLEKALQESIEALRLEPTAIWNYGNLGKTFVDLNRLQEAEAVYTQAQQRNLAGYLLVLRYQLAFLKGDSAQMAQLAAAVVGEPGAEDQMLASQANTAAWQGKMKDADALTRRAMDSARQNDAQETAAAYQALAALRTVEVGNREQARNEVAAALKQAPNRNVQATAALVLARAGDTANAEKLAGELEKMFPQDTLVLRSFLPTIRAAVALEHKDANRAIDLLKPENTIEPTGGGGVRMTYVRAQAFLMLHDGNAAAEFQKLIDHSGLVGNNPLGALARLGIARACALQNDPAKAKAAYQDFLTLWKDADPDIPILIAAKSEYAKLK